MRWRDREEEAWEQKEEARQFKSNTLYLRKHYQSLHLLKAEIRQLEEGKQQIYENYPKFDWTQVKVNNGSKSDPTFQAVTRLQELEERHFWATRTLQALEWAREQLNPEDKQLFDGYILEARSLAEIARRTGRAGTKSNGDWLKFAKKWSTGFLCF